MGLNTLQVIPGYQLGATEILTVSILNQMAKPTVVVSLDDPFNDENYFRNGNFYSAFWTTPAGVNCPAGSQTLNAGNWFCQPDGSGNVVYAQSTTTPDVESLYSAKLTGATGITDVLFGQQINFDLSATLRRTDAISGWIFNGTSAAFTPTAQIAVATVQGNFTAVTVAAELAFPSCAPGAWTYVSLTQDLSQYANVANGLQISYHIPTGVLNSSSNFVLFSRLKIQTGDTATAFADDVSLFVTAPTINTANIATGAVTGVKIAALTVTGGTPSGNIAPTTIVAGNALNTQISTTNLSTSVTISDPSGNINALLANGMYINSANLPPNTTISSFSISSGIITIVASLAATATATNTAAVIGSGNIAPGPLTSTGLLLDPRQLPASWSQWDDEFNAGSLSSKWTISTSGGSNSQQMGGSRWCIVGGGTSGFVQAVQNFTATGGTPFQFTVEITQLLNQLYSSSAGPQVYVGLIGTGKSLCIVEGLYAYTNPTTQIFVPGVGAARGTQNSGGTAIPGAIAGNQIFYPFPHQCRFGYDGTNLYLSLSGDSVNFLQIYSENLNSGSSFGSAGAITGVVLGCFFPNANSMGTVSFDYIRKTI